MSPAMPPGAVEPDDRRTLTASWGETRRRGAGKHPEEVRDLRLKSYLRLLGCQHAASSVRERTPSLR
jgi:hypothetical protein